MTTLVVDPRYAPISDYLASTPALLRRVLALLEADPSLDLYETIIAVGKDAGDTGRSESSPRAMIAYRELAATARHRPITRDAILRTIARLEGADR